MIKLTEVFCKADDFIKGFEPEFKKHLIEDGHQRNRYPGLCISEMMTIIIMFHQSCYRHFKGHIDDRKPLPSMAKNVKGKIFADKGYVSQPLFKQLFQRGTHLITSIRSNMKNRLMPLFDRIMLRKRFIIETINDQLKNTSQIEHSRHRSPVNFLINLFAALSAYQLKPKKPSIKLDWAQLSLF